jgi:hypothetical protein
MTDRLPSDLSQYTDTGQPYAEHQADNPHRRFAKPMILTPWPPADPAEVMTIADLARLADISKKQAREWVAPHRLGRKVGGRHKVSRVAAEMYVGGDTGAHDDYIHGDRTSERIVAWRRRLGLLKN